MSALLVYLGGLIAVGWGLGHIAATPPVVDAFGVLSRDNRRVLTMEWVAEGMTLVFLGGIAAASQLVAHPGTPNFVLVAAAVMLLAMAVLSAFTGARTTTLPMRLCPFVKGAVAAMFLLAVAI